MHNLQTGWEIEASDEFTAWYRGLDEDEVESVSFSVDLLQQAGPVLGRPHVDTLRNSRIPNLKELRVQHAGKPIRILFAFDPRRVGYLILGGPKPAMTTGIRGPFPRQRKSTTNI